MSFAYSQSSTFGVRLHVDKHYRNQRDKGGELSSLARTQSLRDRFFSWRGLSGQSYVCSIFKSGEDAFVADITHGVAIGVVRSHVDVRALYVTQLGQYDNCAQLREIGRELGVNEWHVHFSNSDGVFEDLTGSLLS
jgi:hypothetical protein